MKTHWQFWIAASVILMIFTSCSTPISGSARWAKLYNQCLTCDPKK